MRRYGNPKTDEERKLTHFARYGNTNIPKIRGMRNAEIDERISNIEGEVNNLNHIVMSLESDINDIKNILREKLKEVI